MRSDCERLRSSPRSSMRATIRPSHRQVNSFPAAYESTPTESTFAISSRMRQTRAVEDAHVLDRLAALEIETPSWGYGNSGTRFHVFPWPGAARNAWERLDDAALVHRLTGCCPSVALHIPWDRVDDWAALGAHAAEQGIRIGAINPNLFGEDEYRLGSFCHPDPAVRAKALDHCRARLR